MERGFRLTMTNETTHALGERLGNKLDKKMPPVTCKELDPAPRVSAQREISQAQ